MKKDYVKPVIEVNESLAEGVFAASGAAVTTEGDVCYITAWHNSDKDGRWGGHYKFQIGWSHSDTEGSNLNNGHNIRNDIITLTFDRDVTFYDVWGDLIVLSGDGTSELKLQVNSDGAGNRVSDIHVDCDTQPSLLNVSVEHGN